MFSLAFGVLTSLVIPIVFIVLAIRATRADQGGIISFGEALSPGFLTYVVGSFIIAMFTFVMTQMIDPSLLDIQKEVTIEMIEKSFTAIGAPEDQLEEMTEMIRDQETGGFGSTLMGWAVSLIWPGFVLSLIVAAIMKKRATA